MTTPDSLIQLHKTMLRSQQQHIQDLSELIDSYRAHGVSDRNLTSLVVELFQKTQVADEMTMEIATMEAENPTEWKRSHQMEKHLGEVHSLLAERGIYEMFSVAVRIQLLSGETISIGIHMDQEMRTLPYAFVQQLEYHPSTMDRLYFMDPMGQSILLSKTWKEQYGTAEEIPLLYLYVHQEYELEKEKKMTTIHDMLQKKGLRSPLSDQDLWSLYLSWNRGYLPLTTDHRDARLEEFVRVHSFVFVSIPQADHIQQRVQQWIQMRDQDAKRVIERMNHPDFRLNREIAQINLQQALIRYPHFSLLGESDETQHNRIVLCHYFSVQELITMGMKPQNISTEWWITEWYFWSAIAQPNQS
jgi:hypothetical protein